MFLSRPIDPLWNGTVVFRFLQDSLLDMWVVVTGSVGNFDGTLEVQYVCVSPYVLGCTHSQGMYASR
jgi:hypothetical protein